MKKLAIGCLVILVLAGAATAGIVYYGYLKVRSAVTQLAELGKIPELERDVRVKTPYTPPSSGELTAAQVERLVQVQQRVRDRLGANLQAFERNYKALSDRLDKKDATVADLPALMSAYRDMAAAWMDAKRTQVQALNEAGLSLEEYRWIRSEAYRALDVPFIDVDFGRIAEQAKNGGPVQGGTFAGRFNGPGPAANVKLVERYRKPLIDYASLASFGL